MAISDFFSGGQTPDYLSGLLDDEQLRRMKEQAQQNALMQFGLSALAQGGYSQTPVGIGEILGKAGMAGMQGYQQGIQSGIEGIGTRAKLEEMQRVKKQRQAEDLFRSRIGQPNATRDVMTQPTAQVPVAQGMEAPNFQTQMQPPTVTQEKYFSPDVMLQEALSSGVLPFDKYLELSAKQKTESPFAKVDPSKFTTESINKFNMTGNYGDLVATTETPSMTDESNRVAFAKFGKLINQLNPKQVGEVNAIIDKRKADNAPKTFVNLSDPTAVANAGVGLTERATKIFENDITLNNNNKIIQAAAANPSPIGDTTLLYSFFKVLDPQSTVREGEIDMVKNSRSIPDKYKQMAARLAGDGVLSKKEREDIAKLSMDKVKQRIPAASNTRKAFIASAKSLGLDPEVYIPNPYAEYSNAQESNAPKNKTFNVSGQKMNATLGADGNYYVTVKGVRYKVEE